MYVLTSGKDIGSKSETILPTSKINPTGPWSIGYNGCTLDHERKAPLVFPGPTTQHLQTWLQLKNLEHGSSTWIRSAT